MDNFGIYKLFSALNAKKTEDQCQPKTDFSQNVIEKLIAFLPDLIKNFKTTNTKPPNEPIKQPKGNLADNPLVKTAISHDEFVKKVMQNKNRR